MQKFKTLLLIFLGVSQLAMSQHVDEGAFNDWDYGPHGVYGNLKLAKVSERGYYRIERTGTGDVVVGQINPSGIVIHTATVHFANGVLTGVEEANQWGEPYETRRYMPVGVDSFRVTDLVRGKNAFLPCKYALNIYKKELLKEVQYYSFTAKLSEDKYGVAIIRYERYDDPVRFSERRETAFFDAGGRPVYSKGIDYHKVVSIYDDRDNNVSDDYFGIQDEPIIARRAGIAGARYSYDDDNNPVKIFAVGLGGKFVPNMYGVAVTVFEYERGYMMKQVRYDSLNNKTRALRSGDGIAITKYEYDNAGNKVREAYFDTSGKPMNNIIGVQEIANFYSPVNMLLKEAYFDEFGRPCVNRDGIHETRFGRDELGRIVQVANYELNDRARKTITEEVYMIRKKYDALGRMVCDSYWQDSSTRMTSWNGASQFATTFDEDGQAIAYSTLDSSGVPFRAADGSSEQQLVYDSAGVLAERRFLHKHALIARAKGYSMNFSILKYVSDANGRTHELSYWDADNRPVNATIWLDDSVSAHRVVNTYRGSRIIEQQFFKVGAAEPFLVLDCLKNDYVGQNGISKGRRNAE
jgi:hypothetical protein